MSSLWVSSDIDICLRNTIIDPLQPCHCLSLSFIGSNCESFTAFRHLSHSFYFFVTIWFMNYIRNTLCDVSGCGCKAEGPPGHAPVSSTSCIEPTVKPCQISASTGDSRQLSCRRWRLPIKAERHLCHALSTHTQKLYHFFSPYQRPQLYYQCFSS